MFETNRQSSDCMWRQNLGGSMTSEAPRSKRKDKWNESTYTSSFLDGLPRF